MRVLVPGREQVRAPGRRVRQVQAPTERSRPVRARIPPVRRHGIPLHVCPTVALHGEAVLHAAPWGAALEPLARTFAERFKVFLPKLTYPIRVGTHFNTAFALTLAHGWGCYCS